MYYGYASASSSTNNTPSSSTNKRRSHENDNDIGIGYHSPNERGFDDHDHDDDSEFDSSHPFDQSPPRRLRARTPTPSSSSPWSSSSLFQNGSKTKTKKKKKKKRRSACCSKKQRQWCSLASSLSSLILAVALWYALGVVSIATSKLLLMSPSSSSLSFGGMENDKTNNNLPKHHHHHRHSHHRHHHPLIGNVPPLFLTLQQLAIGACLLRFLLQLRFMGSPGLVPWPLPSEPPVHDYRRRQQQQQQQRQQWWWSSLLDSANRAAHMSGGIVPPLNGTLLGASVFFALGFLTTNWGFAGSSASFVETVKAAEPISSAAVAVWYGIEVLSRREMTSLAAIVMGVVLSTLGNTSHHAGGTDNDVERATTTTTTQHTLMQSIQACAIVMVANVCFSFRGLCQKLFRATPEGSTQLVDDLNLQFRMQQIGVALLLVPVLLWDSWGILKHVWTLQLKHGLWSSGVTSRYVFLSLLNGFCFTGYNLASTYILSRISVVHHAALNCVRRVWAIVLTSLYFVVPITLLGGCGILVSFVGFMFFTRYKVQRQRQPKPLSSLLPVSVAKS